MLRFTAVIMTACYVSTVCYGIFSVNEKKSLLKVYCILLTVSRQACIMFTVYWTVFQG